MNKTRKMTRTLVGVRAAALALVLPLSLTVTLAGLAGPALHQVAGDSTVSSAKRICSPIEKEEVATMMANM